MSLLLDALKKAAEDKKKAANNKGSVDSAVKKSSEIILKEEERTVGVNTKPDAVEQIRTAELTEELTLDVESNRATSESVTHENSGKKITNHRQINTHGTNEGGTGETVSDDALSLLIYKTNSEEKKRKRIIAAGTTIATLLVVALGGVYYYFNLQQGINNLEIKHRTAMIRMEAKTNRQRPPEKTEIIDNLTANSEIKIDKKAMIAEVEEIEKPPLPEKKVSTNAQSNVAKNKARLLMIEKTRKTDAVGKKLDAAFTYYEAGQYKEAESLYHEVLALEKNNRDAFLGLGAIAVIEKETAEAKKYYRTLLKLDPNDPIAVSALTNLRSSEVSPQDSEKYLIAMLEKTPGAAQLNFELGNIYAQQDNWAAAQASYFKAWQNENDNPDYIFNLAVSLDQLGKQKQAINFYKDSLLKAKNKQVSFSREIVEQRVTDLSGL